MKIGLISAVALTALAAYVWAGPILLSNPPKALIIDGWWQRDYALNACRSEHPGGCSEDMIGQGEYTYSGELMAQLSANKDCTDVVVHYFARPRRVRHGNAATICRPAHDADGQLCR